MTTRDRLITAAHDLFYKSGFHAVGLDSILSEVGITKTAFYNHFDSKDDLVSEVLRYHDRWWQDTFREMLRAHGGDSARGQLLAVFDALEELFEAGDYNGCFFVNVAVQFPLPHDPAHEAAAAHKQSMEKIIRELAGYAGIEEPDTFAQEMCLVMEGAYVTRQVTGNPATADIARRIGHALVKRYLPDGSEAATTAGASTIGSSAPGRTSR